MSEKYYIDACIWRDFHENREDKFRPLGEWAFEMFRMIKESKSLVLYSDLTVDELSKDFNSEQIKEIFKIISDAELLKKVELNRSQFQEAAKLKKERKLPFGDVLHAIIARDNQALMITRDAHFEEIQDIVESYKPEDLI
ncbi:MAG: PIN domain-containing protein [Candidatus Woesearchaeota archaeon]